MFQLSVEVDTDDSLSAYLEVNHHYKELSSSTLKKRYKSISAIFIMIWYKNWRNSVNFNISLYQVIMSLISAGMYMLFGKREKKEKEHLKVYKDVSMEEEK